jgi:mono/diheme cytochrome c family protein
MKKIIAFLLLCAVTFFAAYVPLCLAGVTICGPQQGELLFKKHCSACHHDSIKLKQVKDVIQRMRTPLASMPSFEKNKISDRDAQEIADYIYQEPVAWPVPKRNDIRNSSPTMAQRRTQ